MLPDIDHAAMRRKAAQLVTTARNGRAAFQKDWAEFAKERDAYARLENNPLAGVHRERGEKIKTAAVAAMPDAAAISEELDMVALARHGYSIGAVLRAGRFVPEKEDSDLREIRNMMMADRYERDFGRMTTEQKADELDRIGAALSFNGPTRE